MLLFHHRRRCFCIQKKKRRSLLSDVKVVQFHCIKVVPLASSGSSRRQTSPFSLFDTSHPVLSCGARYVVERPDGFSSIRCAAAVQLLVFLSASSRRQWTAGTYAKCTRRAAFHSSHIGPFTPHSVVLLLLSSVPAPIRSLRPLNFW